MENNNAADQDTMRRLLDTNKTNNSSESRMVSSNDTSSDEETENLVINQDDDSKNKKSDLKKDYKNIALLMFLYLLQGLPLGLNSSLPYILSARKVSYADQGTFSFAFWPFSLKLLWAPLVDSIYFKKFGRRKSWLVPIQYLIGIFMFTFSDYVNELLESNKNEETQSPYGIYILTAVFFMFTFLAATQDIVVDAWALTMLSKENVGWASTCNSVGQTAGWFIGNVVFLTLESKDFCNKYIRPYLGIEDQAMGILTLDSFMHILGFVFIITTTLVMFMKKEIDNSEEHKEEKEEESHHQLKNYEDKLTIKSTYLLMWNILHIAPVKQLIVILLTMKIGFATESMTVLKLIEYGVPREKLGLLAVPLMPLQIILPLVISKYTNGPEPLSLLIKAMPGRIIMGIVSAIWVYITPYFKDSNNDYPFYYFIICIIINAFHSVFVYTIFVAQVSFFAKVSDKKIGGTYMTFLNTMSNLGGNWPTTSVLYLASYITIKYCSFNADNLVVPKESSLKGVLETLEKNYCSSDEQSKECANFGGKCLVTLDAYYLLTAVCVIIGIIWIFWKRKSINSLQHVAKSCWKIPEHVVKKIILG